LLEYSLTDGRIDKGNGLSKLQYSKRSVLYLLLINDSVVVCTYNVVQTNV